MAAIDRSDAPLAKCMHAEFSGRPTYHWKGWLRTMVGDVEADGLHLRWHAEEAGHLEDAEEGDHHAQHPACARMANSLGSTDLDALSLY